jgi:hypothetical protein
VNGMEQLKLLMNYTIFHLGVYTTLGAALVAFIGGGHVGDMRPELVITLVCLVLAGICGGLVASSIPYSVDLKSFDESRIEAWGLKLLPAWLCMRLEHIFFWLGVVSTLYGLLRNILK